MGMGNVGIFTDLDTSLIFELLTYAFLWVLGVLYDWLISCRCNETSVGK